VETVTNCMEWKGQRSVKGYGIVNLGGKRMKAHRSVFALTVGLIPPGMCICHICDNPPCVNPEHLFLGTNADNVADCVAKGRHAKAKLLPSERKRIVFLVKRGDRMADIARVFGVDRTTVREIAQRAGVR
jgi:hypothetical protein